MRRSKTLSEQIFGTRDFFRTFGFREVMTALALSLLLIAMIDLLSYLQDHYFHENNFWWILLIAGLVIGLLNHALYRAEHRRSNNYIGRAMCDTLLLLMVFAISNTTRLIFHWPYSVTIPSFGPMVVGTIQFVLWTMFFELCVAGLKRLLFKVGWQII